MNKCFADYLPPGGGIYSYRRIALKPPRRHLLMRLLLACVVATMFLGAPALADSDDAPSLPKWSSQFPGNSDYMKRFTEAITGKPVKPETAELLNGVTELSLNDDSIEFKREDNAVLRVTRDTDWATEVLSNWQKAQDNAEKRFGPSGKQFLRSIKCIAVNGQQIEIRRESIEPLEVNLGNRKLHSAFDLRGIKFDEIRLCVDSKEHPGLCDISGVSVTIGANGFSMPVQVKEFRKVIVEGGASDVTVGVQNPIPRPVRRILGMQNVLSFNFLLPKRKDAEAHKDKSIQK